MTDIAPSIDLNLLEKLGELHYRRKFFWAEACALIAQQLIALRKRRNLNQKQVAELAGTKQPAISRAEQADYEGRNLSTLRAIADALDARIRVVIEPAEDVIGEYADSTPPEGTPLPRRSGSQPVDREEAVTLGNFGPGPRRVRVFISHDKSAVLHGVVRLMQDDPNIPYHKQYIPVESDRAVLIETGRESPDAEIGMN